MDNALQHYIFMCVYIFEVLEAGVFKDFRVVLLQSKMLSSPNKKFVLSRSFLNFLRIFCKLKGEFLRIWENFAPPLGNLTIIFCPGAGN